MVGSDEGVVVEQFLGIDVRFDARTGRFSARVGGGEVAYGKTVDEVEKAVAEKFKPKNVVEVTQTISRVDSNYFGVSDIKVPDKTIIDGFNVDRGRGRGAFKTVEYTVTGGRADGSNNISVKRILKRWNQEAADAMRVLVEEKRAADAAFIARAREVLGRFEDISAEQIFEELSKTPDSGRIKRLKVVGAGDE